MSPMFVDIHRASHQDQGANASRPPGDGLSTVGVDIVVLDPVFLHQVFQNSHGLTPDMLDHNDRHANSPLAMQLSVF